MTMRRIKIGNRYGTRCVEVTIQDEEDAVTMMKILAKNDVPATLYITDKKETNYGN